MFKVPDSHQPSSRHPRHQDDGMVIFVALGTLVGLVGWLVVGGFPLLATDLTHSVSLPEAPSTLTETLPPATATTPESASENEIDFEPSAQDRNDDPGQVNRADQGTGGDRSAAEPPVPPVPALPPMPSSDSAPLPPPSEVTPQPLSNTPLIVPAPKIPERDRAGDLAVVRPALSFTDIPVGFWAKPYIDALTARGVLSGLPAGRFEPNRPMTRAELAAQIAPAFALEPQRPNQNFADITRDDWAAVPIQEAVTTGFMTGYPQGDFQPNATLTRLQVLVALASGLSLPEPNQPEQWVGQYQDAAAVPDWAREQVAAAIAAGILSPSATTNPLLRPDAPATRAEVAVLIYRALAYMGKVQPLE